MIGKTALALLTTWLLAFSAPVLAAGVDPALFQDLHWRSVGPFRGGRVLAVEGDPVDSRRFYFGAVNGGVWRTDDAGRTWQPIFDQENVGSIGAIAVAPSAPKTIYVGPAKRTCAPTLRRESACSGRAMAARRGRRSGFRTRSRSARSWSIRAIPTSSWLPRSAILTVRMTSAGCFVRPTPAATGPRPCSRTRTAAPSTWRSSPAIPMWSMPLYGRPGGRRGTPIRRRAGRAAASINLVMAGGPGSRSSVMDCRPRRADRSGHQPRQSAAGVRARGQRRGRRGRSLSLRRSRRDLAQDDRRQAHLQPWLVFRRDHRRPEEREPGLDPQHDHAPVGRRRCAFHPGQGRSDG